MIPRECKRLAEVDFPIAVVSKHAAREKSIRHGHPSTLHLWWARRPLGAVRALLLALLMPDPSDSLCPPDFKHQARTVLAQVRGVGPTDRDLRQALLGFLGDFANWDLAAHPAHLAAARALVRAAHGEEPPLVVDPFTGGGSIPLEALRVGCDAFASDLNPVACLIQKVLLEDIPRYGVSLGKELRQVGIQVKEAAAAELAQFYPVGPDGDRPIAYLWARTVRCEAPNCGAEIPLIRSFWLAKKATRRWALRYRVERPEGEPPKIQFEVFQPASQAEVPRGTISDAKAMCPCCGAVLPAARVRVQLSERRGGASDARLIAVVSLREGERGRFYRLPTEADLEAVAGAAQILAERESTIQGDALTPVPNESLNEVRPSPNARGLSAVTRYGMRTFGDLYSPRQKLAHITFIEKIKAWESSDPKQDALRKLLACSISRLVDKNASLSVWNETGEKVEHVFGRHALAMVWDFAEVAVFSDATGNFESGVDLVAKVVEAWPNSAHTPGQVELADAAEPILPEESAAVWFTDPPYYDAVPYADLSDFFFVWLKRLLGDSQLTKDPFDPANPLTPKLREAVWNQSYVVEDRPKDPKFFETAMARAFTAGRKVLRGDGVGCVVFAHKTTEGWESLLAGLLRGGWVVTASWPVTTERGGRLIAQESASLSASVHLVCRPRPEDAAVGGWEEILRELPRRIGEWMERLSAEGIRGADLVFSCIGPAMELFSRHPRVETAEGRTVDLPEFLAKVWEVVGRTAMEQVLGTAEARARNGGAGALEEDSRLTALFLWTLQSTTSTNGNGKAQQAVIEEEKEADDPDEGSLAPHRKKGFSLVYDVVRRFAQPLGIHLEDWAGRIIDIEKGVVRLLPAAERGPQLFGKTGLAPAAAALEKPGLKTVQLTLFNDEGDEVSRARSGTGDRQATTLDRVHAAMLLQAGGHATALRVLLADEYERGPDFFRLANALSALYPAASDEKRLIDAMLLAVPRR